ncbi:MAG: alpha/beta hydrolase family protein [Gemmataceae bacterium]
MHAFAVSLIAFATFLNADNPAIEKGKSEFKPSTDQKNIPERYRLQAHEFSWEMERQFDLPHSGIEIYKVRFPSPVVSKCVENNTVHCEYYRPKGKGPFPGTIVLDITAGDQSLSRIIATHLATHNIAALFVQMAYYGPRRPAGKTDRMITANYVRSMENVRQTVLDIRQATAWLESRPEIDGKRLGVLGTSLGSFMGSLAAEMEPRLNRVAILLGGGGVVDAYYNDPRADKYRKTWELLGGSKELLKQMIAPADPLTCAANLRDRKVLIIAGKRDEIVFPKMALALWEAAGKQKIVWYDCTHYGAALYFLSAMEHIVKHLGAE